MRTRRLFQLLLDFVRVIIIMLSFDTLANTREKQNKKKKIQQNTTAKENTEAHWCYWWLGCYFTMLSKTTYRLRRRC